MAEQNVDTARRFTEAILRRDYEAAAAELAPSFEIDDTDIPESTGSDSLSAWLGRWDDAWESWRVEGLEIRAVGEDSTLSLFTMFVKGKESDIELSRPDAIVAQYSDGKIVKIGYYNDQDQARRAVGLA